MSRAKRCQTQHSRSLRLNSIVEVMKNGDRTPPGQHLAKGFPVLTCGETPQVDRETWQLNMGLAGTQRLRPSGRSVEAGTL